MGLVVKKFGGTSVGSIERIRAVAHIIKDYKEKYPGTQVLAVVSAMSGETNKLTELAQSAVSRPDPRELDVMLATGEQVTIALLAMALLDIGVGAKSLMAQQACISTTGIHTNAKIQDIDTSRIQKVLTEESVPVVAGFQGIDPEGDVTTLGRGGSDITAVALAAALKADACHIYTDVDGVYSANPAICPQAKKLEKVCHEEMLEMASLGAKVLHPRSVYFAMQYNVPLVVRSSFENTEGTWIVKEDELMEKPVVTGITYRTDEAKITVLNLPNSIESLDGIFRNLSEQDIFVDMITQTGVVDGITSFSFTVEDSSSSRALELLQEITSDLNAEGVSLDRDIAKVSVVGVGMKYNAGVAAQMFKALASERIDVQMISTSEVKISVVIPRKYTEVAVRVLHSEFIEQEPVVEIESSSISV